MVDTQGNDEYIVGDFGQGAAFWGIAALVDEKGNDRFFSGDRHVSSYRTSGVFKSASQGAGLGFESMLREE